MSNEIRIGKEVQIKRSDGRIHTALISAVNHQSRCVIVEWYERGEVKGKEVDWQTVITLNPSLTLRESYENFNFDFRSKHVPSVPPVAEVPSHHEIDHVNFTQQTDFKAPTGITDSQSSQVEKDVVKHHGNLVESHQNSGHIICQNEPSLSVDPVAGISIQTSTSVFDREECHMSTQTDWSFLDTTNVNSKTEMLGATSTSDSRSLGDQRKPDSVYVSKIPNVSLSRPPSAYVSPRQQAATKILDIMAEDTQLPTSVDTSKAPPVINTNKSLVHSGNVDGKNPEKELPLRGSPWRTSLSSFPIESSTNNSVNESMAGLSQVERHKSPKLSRSSQSEEGIPRRHHTVEERVKSRRKEEDMVFNVSISDTASLSSKHISTSEDVRAPLQSFPLTKHIPNTVSSRRTLSPEKLPHESAAVLTSFSPALDPAPSTQTSQSPSTRRTRKATGQARSTRRLSCLQEIEKIQQRREERRAQQKNIRGQLDVDVNNPHMEFLLKIREYQDTLQFVPFPRNSPVEIHKINVCVRKRPLSRGEILKKEIDVVTIPNKETVIVHEPKIKVDLTKYLENQIFRLDYVFDELSDNELVYRYTAQPLIHGLFDGGMATCFAYGQTGSGKTHTMSGDFVGKGEQDHTKGIYALAARDLFHLLNSEKFEYDFYVEVSYFEIYSGKVFDLLNNKEKLRMLEDQRGQVNLMGLKSIEVLAVDEVLDLLYVGNSCRTSGQTSANSHSSRSHAVFQLRLMRPKFRGGPSVLHGQFSLIDLAGNERGVDTRTADRQTRVEGAEINKSLLALKECIRALGRKAGTHLPFRGSKLTQVLRDSFLGEQSRTCMIAMLSPGFSACENTMNTLRYADRVKELPSSGGSVLVNNKNEYSFPTSQEGEDTCQFPDNHVNFTNRQDLIDNVAQNIVDEEIVDPLSAALERMEALEEEISEDHRQVVEVYPGWIHQHKKLFKQTNRSDCNVDKYAEDLSNLLDKQLERLEQLKGKVTQWKAEMKAEEVLSKSFLN